MIKYHEHELIWQDGEYRCVCGAQRYIVAGIVGWIRNGKQV